MSDFKQQLLLLRRRKVLISLLISIKKKNKRSIWVRELFLKRQQQGDFHNLLADLKISDHRGYFNYLRMTPDVFEVLLQMVGQSLEKTATNSREPISPAERLACTLRYLASGDGMISISYSFRIGHSTVSKIIQETCQVIWDILHSIYLPVPNEIEWGAIANDFWDFWDFPNCVGAIDGKHCVMQCPEKGGSLYYNYKGSHSLVLMAVCDAKYCFTLVDIGDSGHHSDGGVFSQCAFGKAMENGELRLPPPKALPGTRGLNIPHVFVGDEAFPCKTYLMRPYSGRELNNVNDDPELRLKRQIYNYRQSRARRIIENAFGILTSRWRIYRRPIIAKVETVERIVQATCALHNFLKVTDDTSKSPDKRYCPPSYVDHVNETGIVQQGEWRKEGPSLGLRNVSTFHSNRSSENAKDIQDEFVKFFNSPQGEVPWQLEIVLNGTRPNN